MRAYLNRDPFRWISLFCCLMIAFYGSMSHAQSSNQTAKSYIVKFKDDTAATRAQVETSLRAGTTRLQMSGLETSVKNKATNVLSEVFANTATKPEVGAVYIALFRGFSAKLTTEQAAQLKQHRDVLDVFEEPQAKPIVPVPMTPVQQKQYDQMMKDYQKQIKLLQSGRSSSVGIVRGRAAEYGLDALDGAVNGSFSSMYTGKGVNVYVYDAGVVSSKHPSFENRLTVLPCSKGGDVEATHPTHVAGIAAGDGKDGYGVAPEANIVSVSAARCGQYESMEDVLRDHISKGKPPAVLSMSLGVTKGFEDNINKGLEMIRNNGIVVVTAAGNSGADACKPNSGGLMAVTVGITVGATDVFALGIDTFKTGKAYFSNFGSCVDIWAPGVAIESASYDTLKSVKFSGTSMAAPFVSGVAALILEQHPKYTPDQVWEEMKKRAKTGILSGDIGEGSPNLFLQANPEKKVVNIPPVPVIKASALSGVAPLKVDFDASGSYDPDGSIASYVWSFVVDGSLSPLKSISKVFENPGRYTVELGVYDNRGAWSVSSTTIEVKPSVCPKWENASIYCEKASCATLSATFEGWVGSEKYKCIYKK